MKTLLLGILMMGLAISAKAVDKTQLDDRIRTITDKFSAMQANQSTAVPVNQLAAAKGIILLDRTGGALVFGFHSGNGVALTRDDAGKWGPVGFVGSTGASLGAQIGGTRDFFVVLLMTQGAVEQLKQSSMDFGAQASAVGGSTFAGAQASTGTTPSVIVYSAHNGLYAGAAIKGGSISTDNDANQVYYGKAVSMDDILFSRQVEPGPAASDLIAKLDQYSK